VLVMALQGNGAPERLALAKKHLGGVLGLTAASRAAVVTEMGRVVYTQYVQDMLQKKGCIETSDLRQLVQVQQALGLTEKFCMDLLWDLKKQHVQVAVDSTMRQRLDGPLATSLKRVAELAGVDLADDLQVPANARVRLFSAEVDAAIDSGEVALANKEQIEELQLSWGVDNELALKYFNTLVENAVKTEGAIATAALVSGNPIAVARALDKVRIHSLLGDPLPLR